MFLRNGNVDHFLSQLSLSGRARKPDSSNDTRRNRPARVHSGNTRRTLAPHDKFSDCAHKEKHMTNASRHHWHAAIAKSDTSSAFPIVPRFPLFLGSFFSRRLFLMLLAPLLICCFPSLLHSLPAASEPLSRRNGIIFGAFARRRYCDAGIFSLQVVPARAISVGSLIVTRIMNPREAHR